MELRTKVTFEDLKEMLEDKEKRQEFLRQQRIAIMNEQNEKIKAAIVKDRAKKEDELISLMCIFQRSVILVQTLDELHTNTYNHIFRHELKRTGKMFISELEKAITKLSKDLLTDEQQQGFNKFYDVIESSNKLLQEELVKALKDSLK